MWYDERLVTSGLFTVTSKTYGICFWITVVYNYSLVLAGSVILLRRLFVGTPLYRSQAISLIFAVLLPLLWNAIYIFSLVPLPRKDLTPVMFAFSGLAIAIGLLRFKLFTAVPFARKYIIEHLGNGVVVFDINNRLLEANPAAMKILGLGKTDIGNQIEELPLPLHLTEKLTVIRHGNTEIGLECFRRRADI
jgi:PAS domain-containing protein